MKVPESVRDIPREELFVGGHGLCAGCVAGTIARHLVKMAGPNTIVVSSTSCVEVSTAFYPYTSWRVPWIHVAFENAAAVASGIESALKVLARKGAIDPSRRINVVVYAGDGGTFDIGLQALSGMLERGHKVTYVVYDNEAYMNTGIQRSGATPPMAWTSTTPVGSKVRGKEGRKKDIVAIALAHGIPYAATANPAYPLDMDAKFVRGLSAPGPSLVHVLMPCTTGWRFEPRIGIKLARLAVETGMWINYEVVEGRLRVTTKVPKRKPVEEYLRLQGRFSHLTPEEIREIQNTVDREVDRINALAGEIAIGPVAR
ncbi:MAG: thiamine pyrophosphate-dependent enzyme [Fervidicoccaceae archaeon]